ncbi:hypothetical protein EJ05DRAFT_269341 [Pseudovirgaria hyperparasitica]|uniref:Uncharacterized protein n=1 Tax=Pseudovirgaria hyperparasitica TaxID=470096 RepID=A0A6A6VSB7_9PEZI|nr:uncharacterized protein EJ05DRAFT_269341 [Pseudovirgaria hyperparasitica]KAF2752676.1 hypothetical protein EJ05DRAFT_269341 [Pseudovirgaria hyperparasitica]
MASSCSISLLAPSFPIKIVPYDPLAPKPNPKSKSKAKAKIKTAEHNHSETVSFKDRGEWFDIDDFPMPDSNASLSLNPGVHPRFEVAVPSGSPHQDVVGGVGAAFLPDEPEHCQSGQESLDDGGTGNATDVTKTNSATNELLGRSPEFPLNLEGDVAEDHSIMHVEPSDRASDYQANGYNEAAGTEGYHAIQYSDPDTVGMRALSVEDMEVVRHSE